LLQMGQNALKITLFYPRRSTKSMPSSTFRRHSMKSQSSRDINKNRSSPKIRSPRFISCRILRLKKM
jgi:hypothetical protein